MDVPSRRLRRLEGLEHGLGEPGEFSDFGFQLSSAFGSELVEAGPPIVFGDTPIRLDPGAVFEPIQGGVERAFFDLERFAGAFLDPAHDTVSMQRLASEGAEDEKVEGTAEEFERARWHVSPRKSREDSNPPLECQRESTPGG